MLRFSQDQTNPYQDQAHLSQEQADMSQDQADLSQDHGHLSQHQASLPQDPAHESKLHFKLQLTKLKIPYSALTMEEVIGQGKKRNEVIDIRSLCL